LGNNDTLPVLLSTTDQFGLMVSRFISEEKGWIERRQVLSNDDNQNLPEQILSIPSLKLGPYELTNVTLLIPDQVYGKYFTSDKGKAKFGSKILRSRKYQGHLGYEIFKVFQC